MKPFNRFVRLKLYWQKLKGLVLWTLLVLCPDSPPTSVPRPGKVKDIPPELEFALRAAKITYGFQFAVQQNLEKSLVVVERLASHATQTRCDTSFKKNVPGLEHQNFNFHSKVDSLNTERSVLQHQIDYSSKHRHRSRSAWHAHENLSTCRPASSIRRRWAVVNNEK